MDDSLLRQKATHKSREASRLEWRLAALFRPDSIYVHLDSDGRRVRLSVAGLGPEDRATLAGLLRSQVVPERVVAALYRVNQVS